MINGKYIKGDGNPVTENSTTYITDVLTGKASYSSTINGLIQKIADAHEVIQAKAIAMGLQVLKGLGEAMPSAATDLLLEHKLLDTASAINSIVINNPGNKTISAGGSYTVPVGYVKNAYTVSGPTLSGNATTALVLSGMTFYSNSGTKQTGEMPNNGAVSASVEMNSSYTIPAGYHNGSGTVSGPTITVRNAGSLASANGGLTTDATKATATIVINRYKEADGTTGEIARSVTIPAGYYATAITLTPKFTDNAGNVEDILNYCDLAVSGGDLTFNETTKLASFSPQINHSVDYYGNVTIAQVDGGALSDGRFKVTTGGWINAGIYGTSYGGYAATSSHTLTSLLDDKFGTSGVISSGITDLNSLYYTDVVTKGHTNGETKYLKVRSANYSHNNVISGTATKKPEIKVNTTNTNINVGTRTTTKPNDGFYLAVNSAENTATLTATCTGTLTTLGWLSAAPANAVATKSVGAAASDVTYIPITAGVLTIFEPTKATANIMASDGTTILVPKNNYYVDCEVTTAGWIPEGHNYKNLGFGTSTHTIDQIVQNGTTAITSGSNTLVAANAWYLKCTSTKGYTNGETVYITVATGKPTSSGVSHSTNKFTGSVALSAGYYPAQTISLTNFGVTDASSLSVARSGKKITAKTYFTADTVVQISSVAGTLGDGSGTSNNSVNIKTANDTTTAADNTLRLENLSANTTFYAAGDNYFSSFTVLVNDTIAALSVI